jgi:hypothetical protein
LDDSNYEQRSCSLAVKLVRCMPSVSSPPTYSHGIRSVSTHPVLVRMNCRQLRYLARIANTCESVLNIFTKIEESGVNRGKITSNRATSPSRDYPGQDQCSFLENRSFFCNMSHIMKYCTMPSSCALHHYTGKALQELSTGSATVSFNICLNFEE